MLLLEFSFVALGSWYLWANLCYDYIDSNQSQNCGNEIWLETNTISVDDNAPPEK